MGGQLSRRSTQKHHTPAMKFMAVILFLGVASASPQGLGGLNISGQRGQSQGGFSISGQRAPARNVITNTRQATCGRFSQICYGQGLETVGAFPVNPFIAQCVAQVAQSNPTTKYLVRVDYNGEIHVTNNFGQSIEDIEPRATGFSFAAQRQALQEEFQLEQLQQRVEFCGGSR